MQVTVTACSEAIALMAIAMPLDLETTLSGTWLLLLASRLDGKLWKMDTQLQM